ncbi:MAG: hypothetical protein AAF721_37745 [Myxococcota bacterium]
MRAFLAWALLAAGCGAAGGPAEPQGSRSAPAQPDEVQDAGHDGYQIDVEAPAQVKAGQAVIARVSVQSRAPLHMNEDYPAKLRMTAPSGIELDAPLLRRNDAERSDDSALVFPVVFTPKAGHVGHTTLTGELHFAVCGVAECSPMRVPVEFSVEIT